jgi:hypothetical protein
VCLCDCCSFLLPRIGCSYKKIVAFNVLPVVFLTYDCCIQYVTCMRLLAESPCRPAYTVFRKILIKILLLNKFTQVVKRLTCIREVPSLNLSHDTSCPDWGFSWFSPIPQSNAGLIGRTSIRLWPITFTSFSLQNLLIILPFDAILYEKLTASLNKSQIKQNLNLNEDHHNFLLFNY